MHAVVKGFVKMMEAVNAMMYPYLIMIVQVQLLYFHE